MSPDVLIVGAGPTGLTLACWLAYFRVSFDHVDMRTMVAADSKALGLNALSLHTFGLLPGGDIVGRYGCKIRRMNVERDGVRLTAVDFRHLPGAIQWLVTQPQSQTEHELGALLADIRRRSRLPGALQRGVRLSRVLPANDSVVAELESADGQRSTRRYRFVVGCEGKQSLVRKAMSAEYEGHDYGSHMILGDFLLSWERREDQVYYISNGSGFFVFVPLGRRRWRVVSLLDGERPAPAQSVSALRASVVASFGEGLLLGEPSWHSQAQLSLAVTTSLRAGRLMIAGDAAHLFSPLGGTGMNTGMQDAVNLAWKLACCCGGAEDEVLLRSYEEERLPSIRGVADATDGLMRMVRPGGDPTFLAPLLPSMRTRRSFRSVLPLRHSGLAQRYARSGLIAATGSHAMCGLYQIGIGAVLRRVQASAQEPAGPRFLVLIRPGSTGRAEERRIARIDSWARRQQAALVQLVLVADAAWSTRSSAVRVEPASVSLEPSELRLIRPDGFVAMQGSSDALPSLMQYFEPFARAQAAAERRQPSVE